MTEPLNFEGWVCPMPLRDHPNVIMGHGGGGKLSAELVEHLFLPAFKNETLANLGDSAVLPVASGRLAFSTDSYVVRPLFFPGGNIGDLAVNGTVNDIAMSGGQPLYLSTGFIIEEGMPLDQLAAIVDTMAAAASAAGVSLVTGDTKVVDKGHGDGVYINTSGFGLIPDGVDINPANARPGDVVIVSGEIGTHGIAIMSVREGLEFETVIETDSAPLNGLVAEMLNVSQNIHVLRDPTRGGVA
ncbi:MAG: hydrogenase expression/formation protein HypE, partial [Anaerolineae bacterium]|nr:hydrogenase expression/formation protein HypE [Anaerolineae bacterium]